MIGLSSYIVARRHGLTAHQHFALWVIGERLYDAAGERDVAIVTLRSLLWRGLIRHRAPREGAARTWVGASETWLDFELTEEGKRLAGELGTWYP